MRKRLAFFALLLLLTAAMVLAYFRLSEYMDTIGIVPPPPLCIPSP